MKEQDTMESEVEINELNKKAGMYGSDSKISWGVTKPVSCNIYLISVL